MWTGYSREMQWTCWININVFLVLTREEWDGGWQPPPRFFAVISATRGNFLCGLGLFLGCPVLHMMVVTGSKKSNWIPRDVTGNDYGVGEFLSETCRA